MNTRAHDIPVLLRGLLTSLPGTDSISLHRSWRWAFVLIMVSSDEAVFALGEDLGLTYSIKVEREQWQHRMTSEQDSGTLRIDVVGPPHPGRPPRGDAGPGSP